VPRGKRQSDRQIVGSAAFNRRLPQPPRRARSTSQNSENPVAGHRDFGDLQSLMGLVRQAMDRINRMDLLNHERQKRIASAGEAARSSPSNFSTASVVAPAVARRCRSPGTAPSAATALILCPERPFARGRSLASGRTGSSRRATRGHAHRVRRCCPGQSWVEGTRGSGSPGEPVTLAARHTLVQNPKCGSAESAFGPRNAAWHG